MNVPRPPRDMAGNFRLPTPGGITGFVSGGDVLWVYQPDHTYRLRSPDIIDPERRNPNMRWAIEQALPYGSREQAVARLVIGTADMLNAVPTAPRLNHEDVNRLLVTLGSDVMAAQRACDELEQKVEEVRQRLGEPHGGRGHAAFIPQVAALDEDATAFLIPARRSIKTLCSLTALFLGREDRDNNFEHLANRLTAEGLGDTPLVRYLRECESGVQTVLTLRNGQEHPNARARTVIDNVRLMPDDSVVMPTWRLEGTAPEPAVSIVDSMRSILAFLIRIGEALFIHLMLHQADRRIANRLLEIPEGQRDPERPVRYRLEIHIG